MGTGNPESGQGSVEKDSGEIFLNKSGRRFVSNGKNGCLNAGAG